MSTRITIRTAPHLANKFSPGQLPTDTDVFLTDHSGFEMKGTKFLSSSLHPDQLVYHTSNGLVDTVLRAYNQHHNLIIRPDDVWIAIISQLSFHINANAEALRNKFVAHEGKEELVLTIPITPLDKINWDSAGDGMTDLLDDNLVDKDLASWIIPQFSTTTRVDKTVSAMLFMASMKSYFDYTFVMLCGIPNVTLDGTKQDWLDIQLRLDKLDSWDDETRAWKRLLAPVIAKFIAAFDGEVDRDFWSHIVSEERYGSGSTAIGGWITAFSVFTHWGGWKGDAYDVKGWEASDTRYVLNGIMYPIIDATDVAPGVANVDIKIIDGVGEKWPAMLIAGNMGMRVVGESNDTLQSFPMWCCYLKPNNGENSGIES
jgi:hypothetical protein